MEKHCILQKITDSFMAGVEGMGTEKLVERRGGERDGERGKEGEKGKKGKNI